MEWVEELFIDYGADPTHAGPGPHPDGESSTFKLTQGGIRWFSDGNVIYKITGTEDVTDGNDAVDDAVSTIDGFVATRMFMRDDNLTATNPCGAINAVVWADIGQPGVLATASLCVNPATKEIRGFVITINTGETWSATGESGKFDVQNVLTHEFGHVAGLGHVNAPKDGFLTMYKLAGEGETRKSTLGTGDVLGMTALYPSP